MARYVLIPLLFLIGFTSPSVRGDTFLLRDGGHVEGEWLNRDADPLEVYEIQLDAGGTMRIRADRVKQVIQRSPKEAEYRHWLALMPATDDGHWRMAQWCARHSLPNERLFHLHNVITLKPDHAKARAALGYRLVDGEWILTDELMTERGYVKFKGRWRLPQDIAVIETAEKAKESLAEWTRTIRRWERWIGTPREADAFEQLLNLTDPAVTPIIIDRLSKEQSDAGRKVWITVLGQLRSPDAVAALMRASLDDTHRGNRMACLDQLASIRPPHATQFYVSALTSTDNLRIRRAAVALKRLGDVSAIEPLIHALITEHRVVITEADPNRMDAIFGNGSAGSGTGFSTGQRSKVEKRQFPNREVLDALIQLTGVNLQFDQPAWRQWYSVRDLPETPVNLRRDP